MTQVIIVNKNSDLNIKKVKNISEDSIHKICLYKTNKDFNKLHTFNDNGFSYELYGKVNGKANTENKYELPPPIDKELYFGTLCILKKKDDNYLNLNIEEWNIIYEKLFGGFEDLNSDETLSVDSEEYNTEDYTKEGYLKDDFVVDDDNELCEEEYLSYDDDDDD